MRDLEQGAVAPGFGQKGAQAGVARGGDAGLQVCGVERGQAGGAIRPGLQQGGQLAIPVGGQLGGEDGEVGAGGIGVQRLAGRERAHRVAIDHPQAAGMDEEIAQVQIVLHQAVGVQPPQHGEGGGEHGQRRGVAGWQGGDGLPVRVEAVGAVEEVGEHDVAAASKFGARHQRRGGNAGRKQRGDAVAFALPVARAGGGDEQLGEHAAAFAGVVAAVLNAAFKRRRADDALARQHAQQALQGQGAAIGELDAQRHDRGATGCAQAGGGLHGAAAVRQAGSIMVVTARIHSRPSK